jgi:hypothetical protein
METMGKLEGNIMETAAETIAKTPDETFNNETFEQFKERMSKVEKKEEFQFGMRHQGNSRAIFEFENHHCCLESFGFRDISTARTKGVSPGAIAMMILNNPTSSRWIYLELYTKKRAKKILKYYKADLLEEDPYPAEEGKWFAMVFREDDNGSGFDRMMKMIWDIRTGKFEEMFGK